MERVDEEYLEMNNLEFKSYIGKGTYGIILQVRSGRYKTDFALKRVREKNLNEFEMKAMLRSSKPFITQLYDYKIYKGNIYFLMEYCPKSLHDIIKNTKLTDRQLRHYAEGVVRAIKECHDLNFSHGDIKPSNFLVDSNDRVKACDFGLSNLTDGVTKSVCFGGTLAYLAPEMVYKLPFDPKKADVWAIGVTLFKLATGVNPWEGKDEKTVKEMIKKGYQPTKLIRDKNLSAVIQACLEHNPENRPTLDKVLKMRYFANYDSISLLSKPSVIKVPSVKIVTAKSLLFSYRNSSMCRSDISFNCGGRPR